MVCLLCRLLLKLTRGDDTSPGIEESDELARTLTGEAFENTIAFLSMSHDSAGGRIIQDPDSGNVSQLVSQSISWLVGGLVSRLVG